MWDVDLVVSYLRGLGSNAELPLKTLSRKLVLLMALTLASRTLSSELQALDLQFKHFKSEGVLFNLDSLTKKCKAGAPTKEYFFRASKMTITYM